MISFTTHATIEISSDWASFQLISPGATIEKDPYFRYPTDTEFSKTGLFFSQEKCTVSKKVVLKIFIINDGSPVDFATNRGDESQNRSGKISVTFAGNTYVDDDVTSDDGLISRTFYGVPVGAAH
ncbi:hypothetical protein OG21DRAFT_1487106 [Imleria badia]|nr:hypothetical protein OG21DRAFT_1487106 [Imleria badia]